MNHLQNQTPLGHLSPLKRKAAVAITVIQTKQITDLGESGEVEEALDVFDQMPRRNQVTWNAMLTALLDNGRLHSAFNLFEQMPKKNPTSFALMIAGLSRSGSVTRARQIFDSVRIQKHNVFSWTATMMCYVRNRKPVEGLALFKQHYGSFYVLRVFPSAHTFSVLLKGCSLVRDFSTARQVQGLSMKYLEEEGEKSVFVRNALIDVYAKTGNLAEAQGIFGRMKYKDLATFNTMMDAFAFHMLVDKALDIFRNIERKDSLSWNIVISALLECQRGEEGLRVFLRLMRSQEENEAKPNSSTYTIALSLCAALARVEFGKQLHASIVKNGLYASNTFVSNSLITMYASYAMTEELERAFVEMYEKDVVSYNAVIQGLGQNGYTEKALEIAKTALSLKTYNHNTFVAILTSCSHGGSVVEGLKYFNSMVQDYGIEPTFDHIICIIDLLGRAGKIEDARIFLCKYDLEANPVAWATILNACLIHGNSEIGEVAAEVLQGLEPENARSYLAMARVYEGNYRVEESKRFLDLMRKKDLKKRPGRSWVF